MRLNNPGNIRHGSSRWVGAAADQPDKSFVKFRSLAYGYRALWILLSNYYHKYHLRTIRAILQRYAPPSENNTEGYIQRAAQYVGVAPDTELPAPPDDQNLWSRLLTIITKVEQGIDIKEVDQSAISEGYQLAFG